MSAQNQPTRSVELQLGERFSHFELGTANWEIYSTRDRTTGGGVKPTEQIIYKENEALCSVRASGYKHINKKENVNSAWI